MPLMMQIIMLRQSLSRVAKERLWVYLLKPFGSSMQISDVLDLLVALLKILSIALKYL
jgi:hypothetical protein